MRDDAGLLLLRRTPGSGDHFYLLDGLGSVVGLTNSLGDLVATYSYEPFGKLKSSTGTIANPYRWLGGLGVYHDTATGLFKMGTRYYDPDLGRFTQVDPVVGGSANAYDYAAQDPINNYDLDGRVCIPCGMAIGIGVRIAIRASAPVVKRLGVKGAERLARLLRPIVRRSAARQGALSRVEIHPPQHGLREHLQIIVWRAGSKKSDKHVRIELRRR